MPPFRHAVFDLDGTLLDSLPLWEHLGEDYLRSKGIEPPQNLFFEILTRTIPETAEMFHSRWGIGRDAENVRDELCRRIADYYALSVPAKPFAIPLLRALQKAGISLCVATSNDRAIVTPSLKRLGIESCFDFLLTSTEFGSGKESPGIYRACMERLGGTRDDTVVFEDAWYAVKTASEDGFRVIAVRDPSEAGNAPKIEAAAERILPDDLPELLDALRG